MQTILVAGATGTLGRHTVRSLGEKGYTVRALGRRPEALRHLDVPEVVARDLLRDALDGCCDRVGMVVSCVGASLDPGRFSDDRSFLTVDYRANVRLLEAAERAGVEKFVYVSLFGADRLRDTAYADAHERFVERLTQSGLEYLIIRPTGFFSTFAALLPMAARGFAVVLGDGTARTNPVHEADVAKVLAETIGGKEQEVEVGGPEILTRSRTVEMAVEAVGGSPRLLSLPFNVFRVLAAPARLFNRRIHELLRFGAAASAIDLIAPAVGTRTLQEYLSEGAVQQRLRKATEPASASGD